MSLGMLKQAAREGWGRKRYKDEVSKKLAPQPGGVIGGVLSRGTWRGSGVLLLPRARQPFSPGFHFLVVSLCWEGWWFGARGSRGILGCPPSGGLPRHCLETLGPRGGPKSSTYLGRGAPYGETETRTKPWGPGGCPGARGPGETPLGSTWRDGKAGERPMLPDAA